jgi:hypothetical protein
MKIENHRTIFFLLLASLVSTGDPRFNRLERVDHETLPVQQLFLVKRPFCKTKEKS